MDLILFYENGQTFRFQKVTNLKIDGKNVEFDYFGVSTKQPRHGKFTDVVGYSTDSQPATR